MTLIEALLISSLGATPLPELKCPQTHQLPGFPADAPVVLVDGEVRGSHPEQFEDLEPDHVYAVEVTCWNPETGELPADEGIQLIVITTRDLGESTRSEIDGAVESLHRFVAANQALPESLRDLDLDRGAAKRLEYTQSASTWTILTSGPRALTCTASGADPELVEVDCQASHDLAKVNLREAYGQSQPGIQFP